MSSTPADGQCVAQSPSELLLTFNRPVTLMTVALEPDELGDAGKAVDTGFSGAGDAAKRYQLPLPLLPPGRYTLRWMALGADGHKVKGSFAFVVLAGAALGITACRAIGRLLIALCPAPCNCTLRLGTLNFGVLNLWILNLGVQHGPIRTWG
jgi:methionine-rich copper-binding protein CopC